LRSTSCKQVAEELLAQCVAGEAPKKLPRVLLEESCAPALFGVLVEGLADRFEPALCDAYVRLFAQALAAVDPEWDAGSLVARYERVRKPRLVSGKPRRVFVLSRVTLGADVCITSVVLAAAKKRFPHAEIVFVGPHKNYELFAGDRHIHHAPLAYQRGSLRERLAAAGELKHLVGTEDAIVLDPDSRLTQLGLLPVCSEDRYYLFESRAYGGESECGLPELTANWVQQALGVADAKPYLGLPRKPAKVAAITVSFGVGENPAKRLPDPFEADLLALLARTGLPLEIDLGAGGPEAERVRAALEGSGVQATVWNGSFAGFASRIAASRLYVGYDSAGQHVAAACGVPLISIFAGFLSPRMAARWSPVGAGCQVIRVDKPDVRQTLRRVAELLPAALSLAAST
jgi:ADP-heptose:LPS heptosyltransferase